MKVSVNSMTGKPYKIPRRGDHLGVAERNTTGVTKIILTLDDDEEETLSSRNSVSYSLRSSPSDANSATYKKSVYVLEGNENVRTVLRWKEGVGVVLRGLNITDYVAQRDMCTTMMRGTPSSIFLQSIEEYCKATLDKAILDAPNDQAAQDAHDLGLDPHRTTDAIEAALQGVVKAIIPRKTLARVKRQLRRDCRKPGGTKVRKYYQQLLRINATEIPKLPPFEANQSLTDDEILDILLFGTPKSWQREMDRQQYDPMNHKTSEVVDWMEGVEAAEEAEMSRKPHAKQDKGKGKSKSSFISPKTKDGKKHCILHGNGFHDTEECKTLLAQANNLKKDGKAGGKGNYGNKTWNRKASDNKNKAKNDLAAFVQKEVAKGVKASLAASASKKRKSDSESSDEDLNMFDLKDFNYEDMENLKIDSDDDISV